MTASGTRVAAARPAFRSGGEFIRATRREVEEYLSEPRTRARGRVQLYAKTLVALALVAGSWLELVLAAPGLWLALGCLATLTAGVTLVAFCVQHDANHGAYFGGRRANRLLGWSSDVLFGVSSYVWRVKHNVAHHTYTNVDGYDDDVAQAPFLRLLPLQAPRRWYRLQHWYVWPLYALMLVRWQIGADAGAIVRRRVARSAVHAPRGLELAGLLGGKAIFVGWAVVVPLLVYPWWAVAAAYLVCTGVASLVAAVTFQLAHCVEEADFASVEQLAASPRTWAEHEVETTVNFCPRNRFVTWALGGLNFQIEHHLFPRVPHTHYARIAEIVRRNAEAHGIRYTTHPTLRAALRSHVRHLREMGRAGVPVELEMG